MPPTWAYYTVRTSLGRTLSIRGISDRDVRFVFHNPCKRNENTPSAHVNEYIVEVEKGGRQ